MQKFISEDIPFFKIATKKINKNGTLFYGLQKL